MLITLDGQLEHRQGLELHLEQVQILPRPLWFYKEEHDLEQKT